jgi:mannonate dehydratase
VGTHEIATTLSDQAGRNADAPGFGVDIDEKMAEKYPAPDSAGNWLPIRRSDGTAVRP